MITAIEIENFKAFGERQRIELRPITLLFGPNSGGKSSVTHALHYLREVLCEGNLDAHRTWSGGDTLDLGGVGNLVHGRALGSVITIRAEFTLNGAELPRFHGEYVGDSASGGIEAEERLAVEEQVCGFVSSAAVTVEIDTADEAIVRRVAVEINGDPFAEWKCERNKPHASVCSISGAHPVLLVPKVVSESLWMFKGIKPANSSESRDVYAMLHAFARKFRSVADQTDIGEASLLLNLLGFAGGDLQWLSEVSVERPRGVLPEMTRRLKFPWKFETHAFEKVNAALAFEDLFSMLFLGPLAVLANRLRDLRYIGPLRVLPPRHIEAVERAGRSRWSGGVQAWESLAHGPEELIEEASRWLERSDRLDTGYRLERESFMEIPTAIAIQLADPESSNVSPELMKLVRNSQSRVRVVLRDVGRNLLLHPRDVGVGLSQIVPVIVALLEPGATVLAMEQPELHLHPRQQAALGDALIMAMTAAPNRVVLVETHSEHLILRLLRRIRETNRKQALSGQSLTPDQLRIQYVRREGSVSRAQTIDVDVNGDLVDPWPDDFFEQDFKERFS